METKKLDKEHLDQIQQLQKQYAENANALGNLEIEKFSLSRRLDEIEEQHQKELITFEQIRMQEQDLIVKLKERYGEGSIDVNAGTFTKY